jgi:hypothetical protein
MNLTDFDRQILAALRGEGGFIVRDIAGLIPIQPPSTNSRQHSARIHHRLVQLQHAGRVRPLDDQKPIAWVIR